jgi:hypothetical protein
VEAERLAVDARGPGPRLHELAGRHQDP